ncbi:hypothetical protein [Paraliomyxa miuraensis]|uniref:hypothetical protein n=1 Tax=Paraliomyxa miuraensis TaxID=376150 RepID=UPI00224F6BC7|nr:hypothetical protein [Paraliomyxa miuraensis]MCX4241559.1 hypothetical protein [Paraliomyxa miuraensis]
MGRRIGGLVLGIVAAGLVVMLVEGLGHAMFPPQAGFDPAAPNLALVPVGAIALVALAWTLGPLAGGLVCTLVGKPPGPVPALVVGLFFLAADVANLAMIPSPAWLWVVGIAAPLPAAWLGFAAARRLRHSPS